MHAERQRDVPGLLCPPPAGAGPYSPTLCGGPHGCSSARAPPATDLQTSIIISSLCVQICEGAASRASDWSDLVFCDQTTTQWHRVWGWLVVQTSPIPGATPAEQPAAMLAQAAAQGQQLFCLLRYFGYAPKWVRCCAFPSAAAALPEGLLQPDPPAAGALAAHFVQVGCGAGQLVTHPLLLFWPQASHNLPSACLFSFLQVDGDSFKPSLSGRTLSRVDAILARDASLAKSIQSECGSAERDGGGLRLVCRLV